MKDYIYDVLNGMDRQEVCELLMAYDRYVTDCNERGYYIQPVCVAEFYRCEYREMKDHTEWYK